eukprot:jgi/Hompol1/1886/HPOL_005772-RA
MSRPLGTLSETEEATSFATPSIASGDGTIDPVFGFQIDEDGDIEQQFLNFSQSIRRHGLLDHNAQMAEQSSLFPAKIVEKSLVERLPRTQSSVPSAFEASDLYHEMFFCAVDYIGLFLVNRPTQTEETTIEAVKDVKNMFEQLILDIEDAKVQLEETLDEDLDVIVRSLAAHMKQRLKMLKDDHISDISRIRRAYRVRLSDKIAQMASKAEKERERLIQEVQRDHETRVSALESDIYEIKKESRHRGDELVKMRSALLRLQNILKRNGITDTEWTTTVFQTVDDQRVRQSELLDHYQRVLQARDDRVRHLEEQLWKLEETLKYKGDMRSVKQAREREQEVNKQRKMANLKAGQASIDFSAMSSMSSTRDLGATMGGGGALSMSRTSKNFKSRQQTPHNQPFAPGASMSMNRGSLQHQMSMREDAIIELDGSASRMSISSPYGKPHGEHLQISSASPPSRNQTAQGRELFDSMTTTSKADHVRMVYEDQLQRMQEEFEQKKTQILQEIAEIDEAGREQFRQLQDEVKKTAMLKQVSTTKFVMLETAKVFFPSRVFVGIPASVQCDLDGTSGMPF